MNESEVYDNLSRWSESRFFGVPADEIELSYNEAVRYLNELVLIKDRDKSDLSLISEQNSS